MQCPRSPRDTFTATRGHGFPIGTAYQVTEPARLAYWAPDEWIEETTSTRRAMACPWSPPAAPINGDLFSLMFSEPQP